MVDFAVRSQQAELMEDSSVKTGEMSATLDELATINRLLNCYGPSIAGFAALVPPGVAQVSVLDVGSGGGDVARRLCDWSAGRGIRARVRGIDLLSSTVDHATAGNGAYDTVDFAVADLFELDDAMPFDIVHAAQVLHHFDAEQARLALEKMFALARWGVVINDLHRHPLAYYSIKLLTRCLSRSRLIRHDAPLSVLRGFRRSSLERLVADAGLPRPEIRWRWAFRWQVVVRKR